jgi:hypothetical protein
MESSSPPPQQSAPSPAPSSQDAQPRNLRPSRSR